MNCLWNGPCVTEKKGGTQLIKHPSNTPILNRTQTSGVPFFYSRPLISSQSWVLIRIQVVYAHGPSNTQTLHSRNICCSDQEAQSFHLHLRELRRLSAFRPQTDLPLTRQHAELGPFRPGLMAHKCLTSPQTSFPQQNTNQTALFLTQILRTAYIETIICTGTSKSTDSSIPASKRSLSYPSSSCKINFKLPLVPTTALLLSQDFAY